jgi:hypothetical protein
MTNMTLALPDHISEEMKQFSDIRWSEVARKAIIQRLETLKLADKLAQKSKLTTEDITTFSTLIKQEASKRFKSENNH